MKKIKLIIGETNIADVKQFLGERYEVNNASGGLTISNGKDKVFCSEGYLFKGKKGVSFLPFDMFI